MNNLIGLAEQRIRARLSATAANQLRQLSLLESTPSTNDYLLQLGTEQRHAHAVFADHQSSGRGRRGRRWQSPPGSNIYFSLGWNIMRADADLSCLPLVTGVAAVQALQSIGAAGLGLKWPNDIQVNGRKLGGILVESKPLPEAGLSVVVGIGLNVLMPPGSTEAAAIDQPWTSVDQLPAFRANPEALTGLREQLAGNLLDKLINALMQFESTGFELFHQRWLQLDALRGKAVTVTGASQPAQGLIHGEAYGIDPAGNLLVWVQKPNGEQQLLTVNAGEVSVRLQS